MTRNEVMRLYETEQQIDGIQAGNLVILSWPSIITSPGRFEREPIYAPHFLELLCSGFAIEDSEYYALIEVTEEARQEYPELGEHSHVRIEVDEFGFVHCQALTLPDNPNGDCHDAEKATPRD